MNTIKKYIIISLTFALGSFLYSCVDADIDEAVPYDEYYENVDDADAAVMGIYGKLMGIADQLVVLNELRGDMLDVTTNASEELIEINNQTASINNSWANVASIYEVIQNCNDALYNFDIMKKERKLTDDEYNEHYSDIGAVRCWLYYQLGVHFGKIPYITAPVVSAEDVKNAAQQDNIMDLDALIPELIRFMESLPTLEHYVNSKLVSIMVSSGASGTPLVDGVTLVPFFIDKKCLLGDLYLFNNEYDKAATIYREVLIKGEDGAATDRNQNRRYKIYNWVWTGGDVDYFAVLFDRYNSHDMTTIYNAWKNMFYASADERGVREEMIWEMTYDYKFAPTYPFIELFGKEGKGKYLLKPSDYAIEDMWGKQQKNGYPYDVRGISGGVKETVDGEYVVSKYLMNYDETKPFEQQGKWFLYRAAVLNLRFAEAANRSESGGGYPKLSWALVNDGIGGQQFNWVNPETGNTYRIDSIRFSSYGPADPYPHPFYFDARSSTSAPAFYAPWRGNAGIRGRANMPSLDFPATAVNKQDSIAFMEQQIVNEAALELAFEGHRWTDLIRVARRLEKIQAGAGGEFLYEKMNGKYEKAGLTCPDFRNVNNWYLPFYK